MKDEVILALLGGLIGISIIRPDLLNNLFSTTKGDTAGGGGGGDTVTIVPPVVTSPYTQYNVTIGAPSFPAGGDIFSSSQPPPDNSKNAYTPSHLHTSFAPVIVPVGQEKGFAGRTGGGVNETWIGGR